MKLRSCRLCILLFVFLCTSLFPAGPVIRAEGEEYTVAGTVKEGANKVKVPNDGTHAVWKFQPASTGSYKFSSSSSDGADPYAYLMKEDWSIVAGNDDFGSRDFSLEAVLVSGQVYYINIEIRYPAEPVELTLTVSEESEFKTLKEGDTSGCKLKKGENSGFVFTPSATNTYEIYTTGSEDTKLYSFRKANGETIDYKSMDDKDTYNHDYNLHIYYAKLVAGETYVLQARLHDQNANESATVGFHCGILMRKIYDTRYSTITLQKEKYKYTGKKIKPKVKVVYDEEVLKKGRDYTVKYKNNKNAGTGEVTVTGIGYFYGDATLNFTIQGSKLTKNNTKISLSKKTYKYDGKAKKPTVTVKYKGTKLKKGKHYKVSYTNNVDPGKAKVTITGTGKYLGTVSKTFKITGRKRFTWGRDNFSFDNYIDDFMRGDGVYRPWYRDQISERYLELLGEHLTPTEYEKMFDRDRTFWLDAPWIGSCHGMAAVTHLARAGKVPFKKYTKGAKKLYSLQKPVENMKVSSLITYYHLLQIKASIQQQYRTIPENSYKTNIKLIESELKKHTTVAVGYRMENGGGHTVLVYDKEKGKWEFNGYTFNRRFLLCDPNDASAETEDDFIYYNTKNYSWYVPKMFWDVGSMYNTEFNLITGDLSILNDGGFLNGSSVPYVAQLTDYRSQPDLLVSKASFDKKRYLASANDTSGIREGFDFVTAAGTSSDVKTYTLADAGSAYQVSQPAGPCSLTMDYENCLLWTDAENVKQVTFDQKGYVGISGGPGAYTLSTTLNYGGPMSWFTVTVSGTAAEASLTAAEEGYILTADSLDDVTISANNKESSAGTTFSTSYTSVLIYETEDHTLGIKADADGDGVYELKIK